MSRYRPRLISAALQADLETFPVVVVSGARQTGKSTLAQDGDGPLARSRPYLTLDDLAVREQAALAPEDLLRRYPSMTLDEVQREPNLLLAVKALVDRDRPRRLGRFLLTGSANLLLMQAVADSLAGRAAYRTLLPMTRREQLGLGTAGRWSALFAESVQSWPSLIVADEAPQESWRSLARRGGFPVPALELRTDPSRARWFDAYVRTYLERDLRDLSAVQSLPDFRRVMRAAALRTGTLLNQAELARDVGLQTTTVQRHLALLELSHLVVRLEPYSMDRPWPQYEVQIEVPDVRRPYTWVREGEPKPPESISKSTKPPKRPRLPEGWRAREWRRMLDEGVYPHQSALARGEGVSAAAVSAGLARIRMRA